MRIALCDDNERELDNVAELVNQHILAKAADCVIFKYTDSQKLFDAVHSGTMFDFLILDICMPGLTGIQVAANLRDEHIDIPIIFLTSAADYALPAFSVHAARYLLKPVNKRELDEAVDFIMSSLSQKHPQPVILRTSEGYVTVLRDSIVFFETQRNCTICHCGDGQIVRTVISMSDTAELVASMPEFIRVGASFIINFTKIRSFDKKNIAMANGDVIPIPRRAYPELRQAYVDYYCEN